MINFMIISLAVFVGMMASYAMALALMVNKTAAKKMTRKLMKNSQEIMEEFQEDERFEDLF